MATPSSSEPTDDKPPTPANESVAVVAPSDGIPPAPSDEAPPVSSIDAAPSPDSAPIAPVDAGATPLDAAPVQPTVVFVTAPQPPKNRGARGVGAVVVLLGTGLFALVYAILTAILSVVFNFASSTTFATSLSAPVYWVPVIVFALSYLLLVVIVNRAGWWAHVVGGFVVAVVVYIAFIGAAIIQLGALGADSATVTTIVLQQLVNPFSFAAALVAREVPIWVGGLVARRGRSARARNVVARATYAQELAEHRTTLEGRTAV